MIDNIRGVSELLKVLSNENRLMIVCSLLESPMTVSELHLKVKNLTQSALSQHLAILKAYGILDYKKSGLSITYSIQDNKLYNIINVLKNDYCNL